MQITCETLKSKQRPELGGRPSFPSRLSLQYKGPLVNHSLTPYLLTIPHLPIDLHCLFGQHHQAQPWRAPASLPQPGRLAERRRYGRMSVCPIPWLLRICDTCKHWPPFTTLKKFWIAASLSALASLIQGALWPQFSQYTQTPQTHSLIHRFHLGLYFTCCRCGFLVNVCTFRGLEALRTGTSFTFPHYCDPRIQPMLTHMVYLFYFVKYIFVYLREEERGRER